MWFLSDDELVEVVVRFLPPRVLKVQDFVGGICSLKRLRGLRLRSEALRFGEGGSLLKSTLGRLSSPYRATAVVLLRPIETIRLHSVKHAAVSIYNTLQKL